MHGREYRSFTEAGRALGVTDVTVRNRVLSTDPKFSNYSVAK